ncbi:MAG: MBOAT family protein [Planctomycetales bacterium]|nr:MBOAT family protein [Planctomycetales bacterium]
MLFHTWTFLIFFVIVWCGYVLLRRGRWAIPWLLVASYLFYAGWRPVYLALIVYSTAIDYIAVEGMARTKWRRTWLAISLVNNLGLLAYFKYAHFLVDNFDLLLGQLGVAYPLPRPSFETMIVGISFYTFQSMSYTIDFYRGRIPRETSPLRFATYVAFFPQLIAGPIERSEALLPQLAVRPRITSDHLASGAALFLTGWFKKVALADQLAPVVEQVYGNPSEFGGWNVLLATLAFAWQIYFDFSGYSDMARGVARWLGFELMVNFRHPYLATSLSDFWDRWHISLSRWFRDYLYIPLGGNRVGAWRWASNIMIVFVVSGLWHGPAWTFVLWGAWHGLGLVALRPLERRGYWRRVPLVARTGLVFSWVLFGWALFRANSLTDLAVLAAALRDWSVEPLVLPLSLAVMVGLVWLHQAIHESRFVGVLRHPLVAGTLAILMWLYLLLMPASRSEAFIYFQF